MATIKQHIDQREKLRLEFQMLCEDYKEYIQNPVPTVDYLQIEYRIQFVLREVKQIDTLVKAYFLTTTLQNQDAFTKLRKQLAQSEKRKFDVSDLPQNNFSLWLNSESV